MPNSLRVVFDVNVYINAFVGSESTFPLIEVVPPTSGNWAADAISLAFDGEDFKLFASPHIMRNLVRVLKKSLGVQDRRVEMASLAVTEIVHQSGGSIIEPARHSSENRDFEDNLILDLAVAVDALVVVTNDADLLEMNPSNGRLFLTPKDFVTRVVRARTKPTI
jgi:putative PIN family toxin of toxin-antitoxin system